MTGKIYRYAQLRLGLQLSPTFQFRADYIQAADTHILIARCIILDLRSQERQKYDLISLQPEI